MASSPISLELDGPDRIVDLVESSSGAQEFGRHG